ncbi:EAL domain-containing protein [Burkholderia sp. JSH-S8]|nr:EAL domain-containing protein [Burkholderia sp. JSH-S8]
MSVVFSLAGACGVQGPDSVLYFEQLGNFWPDERKGGAVGDKSRLRDWSRTRDHLQLVRAIRLLRVCPALHLGINISGSSVTDANLWCGALAELVTERSLARRLVLEIDEGESIELGLGAVFVRRMQWLGCRVALDHYGRRYGAETGSAILAPDVVKIDGALMQAAIGDASALERLHGLIKLAGEYAQHVVVLGVKTAADARLALSVGATWAQADN